MPASATYTSPDATERDAQWAVDLAVVGSGRAPDEVERGVDADTQRFILVGGVGIVDSDRDCHNLDGHGRDVRICDAVGGVIGECVGADEPGGRRVREGTVGSEGEAAIRGVGVEDGGQRVAIGVEIVEENAGRIERLDGVGDGVGVPVGDVDDPFRINRYTQWADELAGSGPGGAQLREVGSAGREHLNTVVVAVRDIEVPGNIGCDLAWAAEFAVAAATCAPLCKVGPCG